MIAPIAVPDGYTVWAASDLHGQLRATDRLLHSAGLTDGRDRWIAPPRTALVVTGDIVDRGPDPVGLVRRLASLRDQAAAAGGCVALVEGNHELEVLGGLSGEQAIFRALMTYGGHATLLSAGLHPDEWIGRTAAEVGARLDELEPDLLPTLWTFAPYARWRDVLFVHGGPVPFRSLEDFERSAEKLWIRDAFSASPHPYPDADAWVAYREAGLLRVVFGHTPVERPTFVHDGRAVDLDTWRGRTVTLARLAGRSLRESVFLSEAADPRPVSDAPVDKDRVSGSGIHISTIVDAWRASVRPRTAA